MACKKFGQAWGDLKHSYQGRRTDPNSTGRLTPLGPTPPFPFLGTRWNAHALGIAVVVFGVMTYCRSGCNASHELTWIR
jgi:hypothetical protein